MCLGACAVIALLAMAPAASARPGYFVSPAFRSVGLQLKGSNGYYVSVQSSASRPLALFATNFTGSSAYLAPSQASRPDELKASFGKLGQISMRFKPEGPPKAQPQLGSECVGQKPTRQAGHFVGSFRFRGEDGFTTVRSTNIAGEVFRSFRQVCKRPPREPRGSNHEPRAVSLGAYVKGDPHAPSFNAYELTAGSPLGSPTASYSATITERHERMTIVRSADASAKPSTFTVSDPTVRPVVASVSPPFPFGGTATFESAAGHASVWSGDLNVSFPGLGPMPLSGSPFTAELCRDLSCACPPGAACVTFFATSGRDGTGLRLPGDPRNPFRTYDSWVSAP